MYNHHPRWISSFGRSRFRLFSVRAVYSKITIMQHAANFTLQIEHCNSLVTAGALQDAPERHGTYLKQKKICNQTGKMNEETS
jgi:hypothetical protein